MKKLTLTFLLLVGLISLVEAQIQSAYQVHPNPSDTIATSDTYDSPAIGKIENVTNALVRVKWERNEVFLTPNITTSVYDPHNCWLPWISTKNFELRPNETGQLTVHFYNAAFAPPPGQAGSGIVHLKLTNLDNSADTLTAVYTYNTLTGNNELPAPSVILFPNPATNFFTLENAEEVATMRLFALHGRLVAQFNASSDNSYAIGHLPNGNYILSFEDKNGNLFQAVELYKR